MVFPKVSRRSEKRWLCTDDTASPAQCAARRYNAFVTPKTKPTTARDARPAARCSRTDRSPGFSRTIGREPSKRSRNCARISNRDFFYNSRAPRSSTLASNFTLRRIRAMAKDIRVTVIPTMRYRDAPAAIEWLCKVLGFEKQAVFSNDDGTIGHAQLTLDSGMIMLSSVLANDYARL